MGRWPVEKPSPGRRNASIGRDLAGPSSHLVHESESIFLHCGLSLGLTEPSRCHNCNSGIDSNSLEERGRSCDTSCPLLTRGGETDGGSRRNAI